MSGTDGGLLLPVALTNNVAWRGPVLFGVNRTVIVQLSPGGSPLPQSFRWLKLVELLPSMRMSLKETAALPWFVIFNAIGGLVVPTFCAGNVSDCGEISSSVPTPKT